MTTPLLSTKLHRPAFQPDRLVRRPHLLERLDEGLSLGRQLTLVSAPAGFGKTTCLIEWLEGLDLPAAWLSLDALDDDPGRFFAYFVAALQRVDPNLGREIGSVLPSGQLPPLEVLATSLLNDINAFQGRFLLVLDDFHHIQDPEILHVLERMLANQPPQLHLVLITREDPLLPLARLRANAQMTELRAADLRFSGSEPGRFLKELMGLSLASEDIAALEQRTEGWVVGLQLAGLSMRGRSDPSAFIANLSGSHRFILGYLTEEVLQRQPPEIQTFLLQTSILDRLNGDLCDAVTGGSGSRLLLERLYNANLFLTPLDDEQNWYRYHHLFADLLRSQHSRLPKDQLLELHHRASRWYEQAGLTGEAIDHALAASAYPRALQLLETLVMPMLMLGYLKGIDRWMQALPDELRAGSPRINLAFAWMHLLRGSYDRLGLHLSQVEAYLAQAGSQTPLPPGLDALKAELFALQSNFLHVQGKPAQSIELARQSLQLVGEDNLFLRSFAFVGLGGGLRMTGDLDASMQAYEQAVQASRAAGALLNELLSISILALMAIQRGRLRYAAEVCRQGIDRSEQAGSVIIPTAGAVYGSLGFVHYEWNQLDLARDYFQRGVQISALGRHTGTLIYLKLALARLSQAQGDLPAASKLTQEAAHLLNQGAPAWLKPEVLHQQVRLYLAQDNPDAAAALIQQTGLDPSTPLDPQRALLYLAQLRLLLYRRQPEGLPLAGKLLAAASAAGQHGLALQTTLLLALLHAALGDEAAALQNLEQALVLGQPEGCLRTFLDEGPPLSALLRRFQEGPLLEGHIPNTALRAYVQSLLAAFESPAAAPAVQPASPASPEPLPEALIEPLTEEALLEDLTPRELEVLRLMAAGLKYGEIAAQLYVSLNTVRYHVKSIYNKLNVDNRTKAVDQARRHRLL